MISAGKAFMRSGALALCCACGLLACASHNPIAPSQSIPRIKEAIAGDFYQRPWSHTFAYPPTSAGLVTVEVSFLGDYNDLLWVEVRQRGTLLAQQIARGYFSPKQRIDVTVDGAAAYELRLWTDKCCTRYQGFVIRPE